MRFCGCRISISACEAASIERNGHRTRHDMTQDELERRFAAQTEFLGDDKPVNQAQPVVSVVVATYQHGPFIQQCLDGILMQQTSFPFEIIIGEDESTDGTRETCIEYARKHPDRIRLFLRSRSLSHYMDDGKPRRLNGTWSRRAARGTYVAMCEGDDYWTAPDKLQKQVNYLDGHPECSMCFHNVLIADETRGAPPRPAYAGTMRPSYGLLDIVPHNFIHTPSVVYRRKALAHPLPAWFRQMPMGDWPTYLLLAQEGRLGYLPDIMCTYRMHAGGIWSQMSRAEVLEKMTLAEEIVLRELFAHSPATAEAAGKLREDLVRMHAEQGNYTAAGNHARRMLGYIVRRDLGEIRRVTRRCAIEMRWLLSTILRASAPRLWNFSRRFRHSRSEPVAKLPLRE